LGVALDNRLWPKPEEPIVVDKAWFRSMIVSFVIMSMLATITSETVRIVVSFVRGRPEGDFDGIQVTVQT
jgi:hypothetical protein